jgi:antitoxin ParD1/3/4
MPTITVEIRGHLVRMIEEAVARGDYATADEAVTDALCLLYYEPAAHGEKLAILRREIRKGAVEVDAGEFSDRTIEEIAREVAAEDDRAA